MSSTPPTEKKPRKPCLQCQYQPQRRESNQTITAVTVLHDDKGEDAIRVPSDERRDSNKSDMSTRKKQKKKSIWRRMGSCIGRSCQNYSEYMAPEQSRYFGMWIY
ncbi:hypothetical protein ABW21_db0205978 [Orbilia brochopaga]|nr:hypothetical protein ABW21_db0205978 [Drechslerella brochopaga]